MENQIPVFFKEYILSVQLINYFYSFLLVLVSFFLDRLCLSLQMRRAWDYNTLYNLMGYIEGIQDFFPTYIFFPFLKFPS